MKDEKTDNFPLYFEGAFFVPNDDLMQRPNLNRRKRPSVVYQTSSLVLYRHYKPISKIFILGKK